jgi:hypothetical protein
VAGDVDELLAGHTVLTGPVEQAAAVTSGLCVVREQRTDRQSTALVRDYEPVRVPAGWRAERTNLEELVLAYPRTPAASALPGPRPGDRTPAGTLKVVDASLPDSWARVAGFRTSFSGPSIQIAAPGVGQPGGVDAEH